MPAAWHVGLLCEVQQCKVPHMHPPPRQPQQACLANCQRNALCTAISVQEVDEKAVDLNTATARGSGLNRPTRDRLGGKRSCTARLWLRPSRLCSRGAQQVMPSRRGGHCAMPCCRRQRQRCHAANNSRPVPALNAFPTPATLSQSNAAPALTQPPGELTPSQTPQFILFTVGELTGGRVVGRGTACRGEHWKAFGSHWEGKFVLSHVPVTILPLPPPPLQAYPHSYCHSHRPPTSAATANANAHRHVTNATSLAHQHFQCHAARRCRQSDS